MLEELLARFDGAFAENTLRGFRGDFKKFSKWCGEQGTDPWEARPEDLARFVEFMMPVSASGTIERCIASLSTIYRLSDRPNIAQSSEVVLAMKRMYRVKGRVKKQALPLTRDVMHELLAVCESDDRGVRDKLLLRLGYETMRRRSELCSFRFEDMSTLPNGRAALVLRFSKTDQTGVGKIIPISPELVELIEEWRDRTGGHGFLLRSVPFLGPIGESFSPASVNRRLVELQKLANLDLGGRLSGHSFRVGAALDLLEAGESIERIMLRGGWQSESSVIRYLRAWQPD